MSKARTLTIKSSSPGADINITPLIDIVLVLLIIFMVMTPLLEKDIGVRVPATEQVEQHDEVPPDQLVVRIDDKGDLTINNNKVPQSEYIDRLRTILSTKKADDKLVFMVSDDQASYGRLVSAIDGAKQAGAEVIGLATQLPPADPGAAQQPAPTPAPAPAPQ